MLFRLPEINFIDDKAGKPIGINEHIGRRPIAAFGNSDGDLEMLQWTTLGASGARFGLIVHHTDAEREYAYDRHSHFGKLDDGAGRRGGEQMDRGQHEEGLEADLCIRLGSVAKAPARASAENSRGRWPGWRSEPAALFKIDTQSAGRSRRYLLPAIRRRCPRHPRSSCSMRCH